MTTLDFSRGQSIARCAICHSNLLFWFQISVDNIQRMDVLDGEDHLCQEEHGLVLLKDLAYSQVVCQVSTTAVIQDHVQIARCLE